MFRRKRKLITMRAVGGSLIHVDPASVTRIDPHGSGGPGVMLYCGGYSFTVLHTLKDVRKALGVRFSRMVPEVEIPTRAGFNPAAQLKELLNEDAQKEPSNNAYEHVRQQLPNRLQ